MFNIMQLKDYRLLGIDSKARSLVLEVAFERKPKVCPCCEGSNLHNKGRYVREVRHLRCLSRTVIFVSIRIAIVV